MHIRIILEFFEKYKYPDIAFFSPKLHVCFYEKPGLKITGLYDDLLLLSSLFHFLNFIFSTPISFSLCSPISTSLSLSFNILFQVWLELFSKTARYFCDSIYWLQESKNVHYFLHRHSLHNTSYLPSRNTWLQISICYVCKPPCKDWDRICYVEESILSC